MRARTFHDDKIVEVEILSAPNANKLCKVLYEGRTLVRHVDRLSPLDQEAKDLLGRVPDSSGGTHVEDEVPPEVA